MNNFRTNLVNAILFNRPSEFRLLLENAGDDLETIKLNKEQKNILNFLVEERRRDFFDVAVELFRKRHELRSADDRAMALRQWLDEPDARGLTSLFTAVYNADLVG
jgi:hypothetical protein